MTGKTASPCKNYYCFFSVVESLAGGVAGVGDVVLEPLALLEPPEAASFFVGSADADELEDDDGELGVVALPDIEPEAEPEGELGVVVEEPEDDEAPLEGVAPVRLRSPSPQAVSRLAPSAMDTATARVESLI